MAESLPTDVRTDTESTVVKSDIAHTEEGEFCSSEAAEIFELIRDIRDPERSESLEALSVVRDDLVSVRKRLHDSTFRIRLEFVPTVPHCSLATTIGLCLRVKLERCLHYKFKLDIFVTKGMHFTEGDVNKQINDKERIAAAMEKQELRELVEECLREPDC